MLLRTQLFGNTDRNFGIILHTGVVAEVQGNARKAFQHGILGQAPYDDDEFERIQSMSHSIVVRGFHSHLAALSIVKSRESALCILEGWKLLLNFLSDTPEYPLLTGIVGDIIEADPLLGAEPFCAENRALRRIVSCGLNQYEIMHPAYIEDILDYALSSDSIEDEVDIENEDALQSHGARMVKEYKLLVNKNPTIIGNITSASQQLVRAAIDAKLAFEVAKKASHIQRAYLLNQMYTDDEKV